MASLIRRGLWPEFQYLPSSNTLSLLWYPQLRFIHIHRLFRIPYDCCFIKCYRYLLVVVYRFLSCIGGVLGPPHKFVYIHSCHILPFQPILWNRHFLSKPAERAKNRPQSISEGGRIWQVCYYYLVADEWGQHKWGHCKSTIFWRIWKTSQHCFFGTWHNFECNH